MKKFNFDASILNNSRLRRERIKAQDLPLIRKYRLKDWNKKEFDDADLFNGMWVLNEDRSVIFTGLGGGSFEIPEMYILIYKGEKIGLEHQLGESRIRIWIPLTLSLEHDFVLALAAEALAIYSGRLTVEFA